MWPRFWHLSLEATSGCPDALPQSHGQHINLRLEHLMHIPSFAGCQVTSHSKMTLMNTVMYKSWLMCKSFS